MQDDVANRVAEIVFKELYQTNLNYATLWWQGPGFLSHPVDDGLTRNAAAATKQYLNKGRVQRRLTMLSGNVN